LRQSEQLIIHGKIHTVKKLFIVRGKFVVPVRDERDVLPASAFPSFLPGTLTHPKKKITLSELNIWYFPVIFQVRLAAVQCKNEQVKERNLLQTKDKSTIDAFSRWHELKFR
jgi:hypothetical protein